MTGAKLTGETSRAIQYDNCYYSQKYEGDEGNEGDEGMKGTGNGRAKSRGTGE